MTSIYDFDDYKAYLAFLEAEKAIVPKGFRSRLAENIGVQSAFITQVLNSGAHFSLEQGLQAAGYLRLKTHEKNYFLLLIQKGRAGSVELEQHFTSEIEKIRADAQDIEKRLSPNKILSEEAMAEYYSQWFYAAIYILISIPKFQNLESISSALKLDKETTQKALSFLNAEGLIQLKNGRYTVGEAQIHLSKNSPLVFQHHQNWRVKAMSELASKNYNKNLHYSNVSSLSEKDAQALRKLLIDTIEKYVDKIKPSPEETAYAFNLDYFSLVR